MELKKRLQDGHAVDEKGYFDSYRENIFRGRMSLEFQEMFNAGSGDELRSKAEAVHSSSMLSYNFFHWIDEKHPFKWNDIEYSRVLFEVKMKTIIGSNAPANMDVVLVSKDGKCLLFIESKFLEYTEKEAFNLSKSYEDPNKWYTGNVDWITLIKSVPVEDYKYKGGIKQLITHLFGILGLKYENKKTALYTGKNCKTLNGLNYAKKQMDFITLIFKPKEEYKEFNDYKEYETLFIEFKKQISSVNGLDVVPQWITYSKLWNEMKSQISPELKGFLWERYMQFAEGK